MHSLLPKLIAERNKLTDADPVENAAAIRSLEGMIEQLSCSVPALLEVVSLSANLANNEQMRLI
jgi:hypothetical protein